MPYCSIWFIIYKITGLENFERKIVNIFLPIWLNICLGCSKEPSHWDGSFEYPQHMFWLRNKTNYFLVVHTLNLFVWFFTSQSTIFQLLDNVISTKTLCASLFILSSKVKYTFYFSTWNIHNFFFFIRPKKENRCVYGLPTDPVL